MTSAEKGYNDMICPFCLSALMYPHEELHDWSKCELCGFCNKRHLASGPLTKIVGHDDKT